MGLSPPLTTTKAGKVILYKSRGEISQLVQPTIQFVFLAYFDLKSTF